MRKFLFSAAALVAALASAVASAAVLHPSATASWSNLRFRVEDLRPDDGLEAWWRFAPGALPSALADSYAGSILTGAVSGETQESVGPLADLRIHSSVDFAGGQAAARLGADGGQLTAAAEASAAAAISLLELGRDWDPAWLQLAPFSRLIIEVDAQLHLAAQDNPGDLRVNGTVVPDEAQAGIYLRVDAENCWGCDRDHLALYFNSDLGPSGPVSLSASRTLSVRIDNASLDFLSARVALVGQAWVQDGSVGAVPEPGGIALAGLALGTAAMRRRRREQISLSVNPH